MTDTEEPRRCPSGVLEADCEFCQRNGCMFHRPDQQPCKCSAADRHEPTRGRGHVTTGGYVVGSISDGVQAMFHGTTGECTVRLAGGAGDGQEIDHVQTRGGRPVKAFEIKGHRYERFANVPGADGVWVYDYAPSPGVPLARMKKLAENMPEPLKGDPYPIIENARTNGMSENPDVRPANLPFEIVEDLPGSMPPPITGTLPSGSKLPPGAEPVIHDMGGAQPVPDEPPDPGWRWVRHGDCSGAGCGDCDQRGWRLAKNPTTTRGGRP